MTTDNRVRKCCFTLSHISVKSSPQKCYYCIEQGHYSN